MAREVEVRGLGLGLGRDTKGAGVRVLLRVDRRRKVQMLLVFGIGIVGFMCILGVGGWRGRIGEDGGIDGRG